MKNNKMTLFYILKLKTSDIMSNNLYIKTTFKEARKNAKIISVGDNQVLKFIRNIKDESLEEIKEKVDYLNKNKKELMEQKEINISKIIEIQNEINDILFVPDLIFIKTDTTKKDYKYIARNHFKVEIEVNNKVYIHEYKRLCAGAGQLRQNSATFVNAELYDMLIQIMMCGLTKKSIGKINLAKFGAYFALNLSATRQVTTPRICVVPDYEFKLENQKVDWIYTKDDGEMDIETRYIDFQMNAFDGSGMICPRMAEIWQKDLKLDYLPSSFIIRSPWIKGLVSVFDFHKFAKEIAKTETIKDLYGVEYNIEDIDVILTASMFKMFKKFQSFQEYMYYHQKYHHSFGVTRVNKKESDFVTPLNYQYIQSNNFTESSIKELAQPTIDWIFKTLSGNPLYVYLFLIGLHENDSVEQIEKSLDFNISKCLLYNHEILKDPYVLEKIYSLIKKKINLAKIGKIFVEGSYDFQIPDLYAMAEHAFGMEIHGLLPAKCLYSRRWVEKGVTKVSCQRSPLVAPSENQIMNVYCNDECKKWFKYIQWGNVLSIFDLTVISMSDSDRFCHYNWQQL